MLFTDIEHCAVNECPDHEMKCRIRFRHQCDIDRCDWCTAGYNCKRCRKYEKCQDGHRNADIQRARRYQLNQKYKDLPPASPVVHIDGI